MHWYVEAFRKYAVFSGRAGRREYWMFFLVNVVVGIVLGVLDLAIHSQIPAGVYGLATLLPSLAVGCRRLHDTDRTGWWQLLLLIPLLGSIALIVLCAVEGTQGSNRHGPRPVASTGRAVPSGA
ncbi:DUF805 domain-containing protein [Streptomyces fuscigenes]|jgi:uncharacterized membrane protein YhaH (DUF805 family)|uniref:DUF805 domain-containing protein n=1 Tax=Streptomyces fuscigenes TaxID=1528880 RepID=UPI001F3B258F|nr:DUF805 domain-containing protein [Streptomyces fuscigenes]MCF3960864.1 DUF805 domain-containing protein [Streptomyces fuscigenes]